MKKPTLHTWRLASQIGVAVAFIIIPWLNHLRISVVYGNFLSFHFYNFPLADPLAVLQVTVKNSYFCVDLLMGAGLVLLFSALLGTAFCSWICPFGMLSEWGYQLSQRRRSKNRQPGGVLPRWGFRTKMLLFMGGIWGFMQFSTTPVLNQLSLPAWYSRIFQFWFEQGHISLAIFGLVFIVILEAVIGRRLWCRYICPQSVLIVLVKQLNERRLRIAFQSETCVCKHKTGAACVQACSLGLDPKDLARWPETECNNCGDCIVACKRHGGALTFQTFRETQRP